jgi:LacI family transcriptional regulator
MVTIRDVAREAGVSVATVSRVFNDSGPVRPDTRQRVREIAGRLRYAPHGAARSLTTSRTSTLGVLLPDLHGEFFSEVMRGIDEAARRLDYHLLVSNSHSNRLEVEAAMRAMRGRVDGLVVMSPDVDAEALAKNLPPGLPVVLLSCAMRDGPGTAFDAVDIDNYGGARAMVSHLLALGHRRIAVIRGGRRNHDAAERLRGSRAALRAGGAEWREGWAPEGDFTEASGYDAARALLARRPRPTAIFASNDCMAVGALGALREAGARVPKDVAVAGFDDIPLARFLSPPLSSVHVPIGALGARATGLLLAALREGDAHVCRREIVPTRLVIRASCGGAGSIDASGPRSPE